MTHTSAESAIAWVESHNKTLTTIEWIGVYEALKAELSRAEAAEAKLEVMKEALVHALKIISDGVKAEPTMSGTKYHWISPQQWANLIAEHQPYIDKALTPEP